MKIGGKFSSKQNFNPETTSTQLILYFGCKFHGNRDNVRLQPRRPTASQAAFPAAWPSGRGQGFCPSALLWWDPTWSTAPGAPASSSGALSTGQTWTCWSRSRGGHKNDLRVGTPLLWGKAERVGAVQPGEEKAPMRPNCGLSVLKGGL